MKILLVEDDQYLAQALIAVLRDQHYVVEVATDGETAWEFVQAFAYDLILLDVILPKLDGISLCQRLRGKGDNTPVLLLTGKNSTTDKVIGLDAGADDYLIKPFELKELLARIRVLLRRSSEPLPPVLVWEELRLDPTSCEVTYGNQLLTLTPKEYRLLELFLRNSSRVFSRNDIIEKLWSLEEIPNEGTVTAHIMGLRQKLKTAGAPADFIETVYGLGYRLKLPITESVKTSQPSAKTKKSSVQQQTPQAIAKVWEQFKDKFSDRVVVLERAAKASLDNTLCEQLRQQARQKAHQLGGGLGMFGFAEGSRLAKELEQILHSETTLDPVQAARFFELVVALRLEMEKASTEEASAPVRNYGESLVLLIGNDPELTEKIRMEAASWKVQVEVATDLSVARNNIKRQPPDAVLLDLSILGADGLTLLAELKNRTPPIPAIVLTVQDSFSDRLEVARLGGKGFLHKPVPPAQILEVVTKILKQIPNSESKVMVVDDDLTMLNTIKTLLEPWGVKVITLDDPLHFWDVLAEACPDLLILDVEIPHFSGIDLCRVVRNDPRWSNLPVIFLTAHTDANIIQQVFAAGADDYVSKLIKDTELVPRVISHIKRSR